MFLDDVAALSKVFSVLSGDTCFRLCLETGPLPDSEKFGIDPVAARLVCTYRGNGVQYGISTDGGQPARVFSVPTGAPILFKGTMWPEGPQSGLMYRLNFEKVALHLTLETARGPVELDGTVH